MQPTAADRAVDLLDDAPRTERVPAPPESVDRVAHTEREVIVSEPAPATLRESVRSASAHAATPSQAMAVGAPLVAAIADLADVLDSAKVRSDLEPTLLAWSRRWVPATRVKLLEGNAVADRVLVRRDAKTGHVMVRAPAGPRASVEFEMQSGPFGIATGELRLLALASRLCGSALGRFAALDSLAADHASGRPKRGRPGGMSRCRG